MSDLNSRASQLADLGIVKLLSRIGVAAIAFVGLQAWNDLKDTGRSVNQVLINQSRQEEKLISIDKRVENLEDWQKQINYKGPSQ